MRSRRASSAFSSFITSSMYSSGLSFDLRAAFLMSPGTFSSALAFGDLALLGRPAPGRYPPRGMFEYPFEFVRLKSNRREKSANEGGAGAGQRADPELLMGV